MACSQRRHILGFGLVWHVAAAGNHRLTAYLEPGVDVNTGLDFSGVSEDWVIYSETANAIAASHFHTDHGAVTDPVVQFGYVGFDGVVLKGKPDKAEYLVTVANQ